MPANGSRIDVEGLKARLLDGAEHLLAQWLPGGKRAGHEYECGDLSGAPGKSLKVNLRTGAWADFAGDAKGGDLISLYGAIYHGGDNAAALKALAADAPMAVHLSGSSPKKQSTDVEQWRPLRPVPADAPHYTQQWAHYARGVPAKHWEYREADGELIGVVCRFESSDGGKDVQPLSYCEHASNGLRQWRYKAFAEPRPLYGLDRLPADLSATVYVVEGEKCADALHALLGKPVVSWPGGAKAVRKADFSPLYGRTLILWPDADAKLDKEGVLLSLHTQPGMQAMQAVVDAVAAHCPDIGLIDVGAPGERADGWDCADAVADGWDRTHMLEFIRANVRRVERAQKHLDATAASQRGGGSGAPPGGFDGRGGGSGETPGANWRDRLIYKKHDIAACTFNVIEILMHRPEWAGVIAFDEFMQRVVRLKPAPFASHLVAQQNTEWTDVDDTLTSAWLAQAERMQVSSAIVMEAVSVVARANGFHPVRTYLQGLVWDGQPRLDAWLEDYLNVPRTEYSTRVAQWFLMGMVARVLSPGCKFDYCLVLEGTQGLRKSSALRVLGGEWFSDTELDLGNKDAMSNILGKWLHEFSEMGSIARAESQRQKSFLSRQVDEFRPAYGRREVRHPRQVAFAGSTNEWQWNKDPTGGRRFWSIEVLGEIDTDGLASARDQLFAEAFVRVKAGERYWPSAEEQRELFDPQQLARETPEVFVELLEQWFSSPTAPLPDEEFTLADACTKGLKIDAGKVTRDIQTRAGIGLRKLDCERIERRAGASRFVYKRPKERPAEHANTPAQQGQAPPDDLPL